MSRRRQWFRFFLGAGAYVVGGQLHKYKAEEEALPPIQPLPVEARQDKALQVEAPLPEWVPLPICCDSRWAIHMAYQGLRNF